MSQHHHSVGVSGQASHATDSCSQCRSLRRRSKRQPWNANLQYDSTLVDLAGGARTALDVGCGDGFLAARLAARVPYVVGLDRDESVLARAAARFPGACVQWQLGNVLADLSNTQWAVPGDFDTVLSNATLHHLAIDLMQSGKLSATPALEAALLRLTSLVAPGGTLGVVASRGCKPEIFRGRSRARSRSTL